VDKEGAMRVPSWVIVTAAVIMAVPFGWGLGVVLAMLAVGRDVGVLPAGIIPFAIAGSIWFARSSAIPPLVRLATLAAGTVLFLILG
jgi:hypothetical protein